MKAFVVALAGAGLSVACLTPLVIHLVLQEIRKKKKFSRRLMIYLLFSYLGFACVIFGGAIHGVMGIPLGTPAVLCNIQGYMVMYWDQIVNFWVLVLAFDIYFNVLYRKSVDKYEVSLCAVGFLYPFVPATIGYVVFGMAPSGSWCFVAGAYVESILPLHHIFLIISCLGVICLYSRAIIVLYMHTRNIRSNASFQTSNIKSSTRKLLLYPFIHLVVEIPTLARRAYEYQHGTNTNLLYMQTTLIALEGFLNVIVYGIRRGTFTKAYNFLTGKEAEKKGISKTDSTKFPESSNGSKVDSVLDVTISS